MNKRSDHRRMLTLMVVPDSGNDIRTIRLRPAWLVAGLGGGGVLVLLGLLLPHLVGGGNERLLEENARLRQRLASLDSDLGTIEQRLHESSLLEERMRLLADLDPIDDAVRLMGVGGPDFSARDPLYQLDQGLATEVAAVRRSTDALLRRGELQRHSFIEILESLEQKQEHWAHLPSICPVAEGRITSGYGRRLDPFTKARRFHRGIDISARRGAPIVATADGVVSSAQRNAGFGLSVKIDHGNGIETIYAHCLDLRVKKGQHIKRGEVIARVGSTGRSTAPHVHYEVHVDRRTVSPRRYLLDREQVFN